MPGKSGVPAARNHSAPFQVIPGPWASVSTFWTSVGRPAIPRSWTRGGLLVGVALCPLTKLTAALASPAT